MRKRIYLLLLLSFFFGSCVDPYEDPPRTEQMKVEYIDSISIEENQININVSYFIPEKYCWEFVRNEIKQNNNIFNGIVYARRITDGGCFQQPDILKAEFIFYNLKPGIYTFEFDSFEGKIDTILEILE